MGNKLCTRYTWGSIITVFSIIVGSGAYLIYILFKNLDKAIAPVGVGFNLWLLPTIFGIGAFLGLLYGMGLLLFGEKWIKKE